MKPKKPTRKAPPAASERRRLFAKEFLFDMNAAAAARRAGYSSKTSKELGYQLLHDPQVQELIQAEMRGRSERTDIKTDDVLRQLWAIAQADPRELVEFRRSCCRYCWGAGFRYQRTAGEMERDRETHRGAKSKEIGEFDEKGGIGYHAKRDPNQDCPECFGDGLGDTFVHDTRKLSPAAARLFAGVKQTKDGLEVKTHDQKGSLVDVGRHLGMFKERHEHSGPDGRPLPAAQVAPIFNVTLTAEPE